MVENKTEALLESLELGIVLRALGFLTKTKADRREIFSY